MFTRASYLNVAVVALVLLGVTGGAVWAARRQLKPVSADVIKKITDAMPAKATAKPAKPRKVLVFWLCQGFFHGSIPIGNKAFEVMGSKTGAFETVVSDDMAVFDADKLKQFDAVIFNNTTKLKFSESLRKSLMDFVKGGKGVIGIHGATDNFDDWPEAAGMMGGLFSGHPWGAGGTWAVKLDDPDHPLNKAFGGKGFLIKDEIYQMKAPYSREKLRVLLSLDMSHGPTAGRKGNRADKDNAVAWIRQFGKGRVFYCSLGHNNHIFWDKAVLQHYLDGIQYALGDLKADATPSAKLKQQPKPALAPKGAAGPAGQKGKTKGKPGAANQIAAALMGDYEGTAEKPDPKRSASPKFVGAQVIALGKGEFQANLLGEFDVRVKPLAVLKGKIKDEKVTFAESGGWSGVLTEGKFTGTGASGKFQMKKVTRLSTTMGAKPPAGAVVLLGPKTKDLTAEWIHSGGKKPCPWKLLPGGVMQCVPKTGSVITKKKFGKHKVHLEFRTTFSPTRRGQGRGNSGVYLQGRYEVQILDSYGLEGRSNECGGIYKVAAPLANMCAPPLQWQTYDITFDAAVMAGNKAAKPPRMTVLHNGVKIHQNVKLPGKTTAAPKSGAAATGGLYLQDHGHRIEFRNIWVQELK